jgi:Uri superfamily endonuclease
MVSRGTYCLCIKIDDSINVIIGSLGSISFDKGTYIYVGSAMNNLRSRVKRHLKTSRGIQNVIHWHIDYLLNEEEVYIRAVYLLESDTKFECLIAEKISDYGEAVKNFGSSDCKCISHLYKVKKCRFLYKLGMEKISLSDF